MRVLICGSRNWAKPIPIDVVVGGFKAVYGDDTVIIHGAAKGADSMASSAAHRHGLGCEAYPADWDAHGRAAGPIRNQRMLDEGKPEVVVAFTNNLAESRGTADMVRRATAAGVPVYVMGKGGVPVSLGHETGEQAIEPRTPEEWTEWGRWNDESSAGGVVPPVHGRGNRDPLPVFPKEHDGVEPSGSPAGGARVSSPADSPGAPERGISGAPSDDVLLVRAILRSRGVVKCPLCLCCGLSCWLCEAKCVIPDPGPGAVRRGNS